MNENLKKKCSFATLYLKKENFPYKLHLTPSQHASTLAAILLKPPPSSLFETESYHKA